MSDIFISYARKDKERVKSLARALEAHGWSVWWDPHIPFGKHFDEVIEQAMKEARCIVVVWSSNSVSSRWVRVEANEGLKHGTLVPVLIEETETPLAFRQIQTANLIGWDGSLPHAEFEKLTSDISLLLDPPAVNPLGGPLPAPPAGPSKKPSEKPESKSLLVTLKQSLYRYSSRIIATSGAVVLLIIIAILITNSNRGTNSNQGTPTNNGSDNYRGIERKATELSIGNGSVEYFNDVSDLISSLPAQSTMMMRYPPTSFRANPGRVAEEQRNVRLRGFLYAASLVDNTDYRLIIGRDPDAKQPLYLIAVVSGLPPSSNESFARLNDAREAFKKYFEKNFITGLPGKSYSFYAPPISVEIDGSLFFNIAHLPEDQKPGPQSLKSQIPTIWEINPITKITFGD